MPRFLHKFASFVACSLIFVAVAPAQDSTTVAKAPPASAVAAREWSGMYSFRKDGEFVQLTVEDQSHVTGFVSRYGDGESDKGAFLDQFFKTASLQGNRLAFSTEVVHGVWFDFKGVVERGSGKSPGDESYFVLKGALTESSTDADKKVSTHSRDVLFKLFPQGAGSGPSQAPAPSRN